MSAISIRRAAVAAGGLGLIVLATMVACTDNATTTGTSSGTLSVQLTDAPFPYDEVSRVDLYVTRVDARPESTTDAEAQQNVGTNDDTPGLTHDGWITVSSPKQHYNLLDLQGGKTVNLGQATIPTGTYDGFRFIVNTDSSSVTLTNGQVLTGANGGIKFPAAGQSGIKIVLEQPISLTANGSVMVVDFDLAHSFVLRGNSISQNGLLFKPVIHATARDITGSISGSVHDDSTHGAAVPNATVEVLKQGTALTDTASANIVASTKTDSTGAFKASFLLPGTYTLRGQAASDTTHGPALGPNTVTVTSGTDTPNIVIVLPKK